MASKVFEHPFDLTKVRLQAQVLDDTARFNGPLDCLRQTYVKEGFRGLYRVRAKFGGSGRSRLKCAHRDYQRQLWARWQRTPACSWRTMSLRRS